MSGMRRSIIATAVTSLALLGCSGSTPEGSLAAANEHLSKKEWPAAIIEAKNALQERPDLAQARFVLGKALLESENPETAAVELDKAHKLGHPPDQVVPLLAAAYVRAGGQAGKVLELAAMSTLDAPEAVAGLKLEVARAQAALGNADKAEDALRAALQVKPDHLPALILRAQWLAVKGNLDAAQRIADQLPTTPADTDTLMLKAALLATKGDTTGAVALYREILTHKPNHVVAHVALLNDSLEKGEFGAAEEQLAALKKERPKHLQTLYFEAKLSALKGDLTAANQLSQQLLKFAPDNSRALHLAGVIAMRRGEPALAEKHLGRLIRIDQTSFVGRNLLARVHLGAGDTDKALAVLKPVLDGPSPNADSLTLAGSAYLQAGNVRQAQDAFARSTKLRPDDSRARASVALAKVAGGNAVEGLSELEALAGSDDSSDADLALIAAHLNRRDFNGALKAVERLQAKQPNKAQPMHLRGVLMYLKGDFAGARTSYEKALAAEPGFFPSVAGLAALDLRDKKPDQARARIDAVLKTNPNDVRAMVALAKVDERSGKSKEEVAALLSRAVSIRPSDLGLRRELIEYHFSKGDKNLALTASQEAVAALPNDLDALAMLGRAQVAAGEVNQAQGTYAKLASLQPASPHPHLALAQLHLSAKNERAATQSIRKAMELAPEDALVSRRAVGMLLAAGRHDEARVIAQDVRARRPDQALGHALLGDVEFNRSRFGAAATAYAAAFKEDPASPMARQLHASYMRSGNRERANALATSWLKDNPTDVAFVSYLGETALAAKDFPTAEARYQQALKLQPDNPVMLNNLAWSMHQQKKPGARIHAERALKLRPDSPLFMDTLALLMAESNEADEALALQRRALELAPEQPGLRLTLAKIHLRRGDKAAAKGELERLRELGPRFRNHAEVQQLLSGL